MACVDQDLCDLIQSTHDDLIDHLTTNLGGQLSANQQQLVDLLNGSDSTGIQYYNVNTVYPKMLEIQENTLATVEHIQLAFVVFLAYLFFKMLWGIIWEYVN